MHSLSPEMLLKLFACLDWRQLLILRQVCTLWKETCRSTSPSIGLCQHDHLSCIYWLFPRVKCLVLASEQYDDDDERFPNERIMVERLRPLCTFRHLTRLVLTRVMQKEQPRNVEIVMKECDHVFQIPTLEELVIDNCEFLAWELSMVSGTPRLRKLIVRDGENGFIGGELLSLKAVQNTLTHLTLEECHNVEGSFTDLAEFPHLESLNLNGAIDVETHGVCIKRGNFPSLKELDGYTCTHVASSLDKSLSTFIFDRIGSLDFPRFTPEFSLSLVRFAPPLKNLTCPKLTKGSLSELACVQNSLQCLNMKSCLLVEGSIADLRNFKDLETLNLHECRKLGPIEPCLQPSDLPSLEIFVGTICLAKVSDAEILMRHKISRNRHGPSTAASLDKNSQDFYNPIPTTNFVLSEKGSKMCRALSYSPFSIETVQIGSRVGWRWCCKLRHRHLNVRKFPYYFETNWLNDAPEIGSEEHNEYCKVVEKRTKKRLGPFVGVYKPPKTKDEYEELVINYIRNNQN